MLNFNHWEKTTAEEEDEWNNLKMWFLDYIGKDWSLNVPVQSLEFLLTYIAKLEQDSARLNTLDYAAKEERHDIELQAVVPSNDPPHWRLFKNEELDEIGYGNTVREAIDKYRMTLLEDMEKSAKAEREARKG